MDKVEAIKRLDALEGEAKKLREIIENGDKLEYDRRKLYIGIIDERPYLLAGKDNDSVFYWHSFDNISTEMTYGGNQQTGQGALDYLIGRGTVVAFADRFEGMKFFYDAYMARS